MPKKGKKAKVVSRQFEETIYFHEAALAGYTYVQIASLASARFGRQIGREVVRNRLRKYRAERIVEGVDELRGVEVDRLDRQLVALDKMILAPDLETEVREDGKTYVVVDNRKEKIAAITASLRIADRRAKLLGLDAPVQAEVTVTNVAPIDLEMEALAAEVAAKRETA